MRTSHNVARSAHCGAKLNLGGLFVTHLRTRVEIWYHVITKLFSREWQCFVYEFVSQQICTQSALFLSFCGYTMVEFTNIRKGYFIGTGEITRLLYYSLPVKHFPQDLYSLSRRTSYHQISKPQSLEAAWLHVMIIVSLWNLTGISATLLRRCSSNFRVIGKV